jgi:hypothetical protein
MYIYLSLYIWSVPGTVSTPSQLATQTPHRCTHMHTHAHTHVRVVYDLTYDLLSVQDLVQYSYAHVFAARAYTHTRAGIHPHTRTRTSWHTRTPSPCWQVGYFGVGFFSVFALSDAPSIRSGARRMTFRWGGAGGENLFAHSEAVPPSPPHAGGGGDDGVEWTTFAFDLKPNAEVGGGGTGVRVRCAAALRVRCVADCLRPAHARMRACSVCSTCSPLPTPTR